MPKNCKSFGRVSSEAFLQSKKCITGYINIYINKIMKSYTQHESYSFRKMNAKKKTELQKRNQIIHWQCKKAASARNGNEMSPGKILESVH